MAYWWGNQVQNKAGPANPLTLAIDVGGSHLKAAVLTAAGKLSKGPLRTALKYGPRKRSRNGKHVETSQC